MGQEVVAFRVIARVVLVAKNTLTVLVFIVDLVTRRVVRHDFCMVERVVPTNAIYVHTCQMTGKHLKLAVFVACLENQVLVVLPNQFVTHRRGGARIDNGIIPPAVLKYHCFYLILNVALRQSARIDTHGQLLVLVVPVCFSVGGHAGIYNNF